MGPFKYVYNALKGLWGHSNITVYIYKWRVGGFMRSFKYYVKPCGYGGHSNNIYRGSGVYGVIQIICNILPGLWGLSNIVEEEEGEGEIYGAIQICI